jgi:bile acid-coenzyme A ligase
MINRMASPSDTSPNTTHATLSINDISGPLLPVGSLLTLHARRDPFKPALTFEGQTWTRGEIEARANRRARALELLGVREGDFVTIALPNGPECHETAFAVWKLGAVPAPVSANLPDIELRAIVELTQPRLVVGVAPERVPGFATLPAKFEPDPALSPEPLPEKIPKHWKAATSGGSTGRPKVIVDNRPAMFNWKSPLIGMTADTVALMPGPLHHNGPFFNSNMALFTGGHLVEMARFDAAETLRLIEKHRVRWVYLVPTMMKRIWDLPASERLRHDVSSLEVVVHMAASCPIWLKEKWIDWLGPDRIVEFYAGTEGLGGAAITGREWLTHKGSVGRPNGHSELKILNEAGEPCATGEIGELFFLPKAGRGATYHYLGAESRAAGEFESYGDMGYLDADGYLYLADRRTDLIISGGANIYPAEIEAALDSHRQIRSSVVIGLPDEDMGQTVHAIVQVADDAQAQPSVTDILAHLAQRLAKYKLPRTFEFTSNNLRDDAGKVRRSALREERIARLKGGHRFTPA